MTHFSLMVLLPKETKRDEFEQKINELLAPYDENKSVPPYDHPCYCVGRKARDDAQKSADAMYGGREDRMKRYQTAFNARNDGLEVGSDAWLDLSAQVEREINATWQRYAQEAFERDSRKDQPDRSCQECKGTGTYISTYNPESRWDWWTMDGRWEGWDGGKQYVVEVPKLPADWDVWAILTKNGEWHEKGKMGYWAMSSDNKSTDDWNSIRYEIVSGHQDCYAVLLDVHI